MISLETNGMEEVKAILESIAKYTSSISGAELRAKSRSEGAATNAEIIQEYLIDQDRDFVTLSETESESIAQTMANRIERAVEEIKAGEIKSSIERKVDNAIADGYIKAIQRYMEIVTEHIEQGKSSAGSFEGTLSPKYAARKQAKYGFDYPIGKASGQLLDNLDSGGAGKANIRVIKSK
jgi:uncharacterized protein